MTLSTTKEIIYFVADGISSPEFFHLRNTYNRIIKRDNVILISINNKTDINDKSFLESSGTYKPLKNISEIDLNLSESSFIFPNASSLPTGNKDFIKSKTGCFIGGVNSKDTIQKQINSATSLDIDFLFSDLLPTEVSNFINSEELTFFCKRITFIQPYFNESNQLHDDTNEKFLFLYQTDHKESQRGNKSIIYKALSKAEHCRGVNLDSLEVSNWFTGAIPSKTCRKVITDTIDPIFYNYLFDLCSKERIELVNLWGSGTTSPERFFIYESDATANWFYSEESTTSLRSLIMNVLHEKVADDDNKDIPPRNNSSYRSDLKVISNFVSDSNASKEDFSKEMSGNIAKTNFHDTFSNDLFITAISHNSNTIKDYSWKLTHDSINHLIHTKDIEDIPDQIINTLFCHSLRRIYDKEIKQSGYLFLFNIFSTSNKHFLESISRVLNSKRLKTSPAGVFASVQYLLQSYGSDKDSRKEAFLQLVAIIDSILNRSSGAEKEALNRVLARLLLSLDDLPRYEQLIAECIESKTKGIVGDSVYYKIMEDLTPSAEELEYFEKICISEKDLGLDKITTQLSACIIKILKGDTNGILEEISNPRNPATDFTNSTSFMLQLSLICISSEQKSIAEFIISKISLRKTTGSLYNLIGFTALEILLEEHNKLDEQQLTNNITYDYIGSIFESERIMLPYFLFIFLEIIFLATSNKQGVEFTNYHRLMVPYSNKPYFDKILGNVPAIGSKNAFLQSFSKRLYDNLPAKESSIINLSTLP